jgi:serine/threonine protein kinase
MKCRRCQFDNPEGTRFCGHCGLDLQATTPKPGSATVTYQTPIGGLERGTTFARRFEIIEEVGRGGMGTVYKAFDTKIRELVALKVLKPDIAADPDFIARFQNELKLARKVAHRHVCRMYDLAEEGPTFYLSMEYVQGEDLKSFIRRSGHLNEAKAVALGRQIAEGLAEAHRLGVVHRDLKPQNIMIDGDGNAKIMDFGIARSLQGRGLTATGAIIGTPEYMSPEQTEARDVDKRSDIYSLGVILYEMITGRVPFEGETPFAIALKHRGEPAPDPKDANDQVSPTFSRVILKCLEKDKDRRYQQADEVAAELDRIAQERPTPRPSTPRRKPTTSREITVKFNLRRVLVPVLAVVLAAAGGLLIFRPWASRQASEKRATHVELGPSQKGGETMSEAAKTVPSGPAHPVASGQAIGQGRGDLSGILPLIAPIIGEDSAKLLEGKSSEQIDRFLTSLKDKVPAFAGKIGDLRNQIREARRYDAAGDPEASKRSYARGDSEMRKLLAQVNEKEQADHAKSDMDASKKKAQEEAAPQGSNLLTWIAAEKEKDALDAYQRNDFAGARILYGILGKVYLLSVRGGNEDQCLSALRELADSAGAQAEAAQAPAKEAWLFTRAREEEKEAETLTRNKAYPEAAERFILAAFLYEKAKDVALESAQTPGK